MSHIRTSVEKSIAVSPERVYGFLTDYRNGRPKILPPDHFSRYVVEEGGRGAGTIVRYLLRAGGRERAYRMRAEELDEGSVIREHDTESSFVTTWELMPGGEGTLVRLTIEWDGAGGISGFFERLFAPGGVRRVYAEVLERLAASVAETPDARRGG